MIHPSRPEKTLSLAGYGREPLLQPVMRDGRRLFPRIPLPALRSYSRSRLDLLPGEYQRFERP